MANSPQARKRARQGEDRRQHNAAQRATLRTAIKKVVNAADNGEGEQAATLYKAAVPVIDSLADKGIIHKNKAARHKSRLNKRVKALATA